MLGRQAFRSLSTRATPELGLPLSNYFRQFSTSPRWQAEDGSNASKGRATSKAPTGERPNRSPSTGPPVNRFSGAATQNNGQPRIVDVKSLPRGGLRGRGRGMARGGRGGAAGAGAPRTGAGSLQAGRGRGLGGRGGRGRGRGRGRRGRGGGLQDGKGDEGDRKNGPEDLDAMDPVEMEFDQFVRFGEEAEYEPALTKETLAEYMPAVAAASAPKATVVLQNLAHLGTGERVGASHSLQASNYAKALKKSGITFFADSASREAAEAYLQKKRLGRPVSKAKKGTPRDTTSPIIQDVEESIKKVILDQAVAGQHEGPRPALDPVSISRNWHLRAETWGQKQTDAFEAKLTSLLARGSKGGSQQAKGKSAKASARA